MVLVVPARITNPICLAVLFRVGWWVTELALVVCVGGLPPGASAEVRAVVTAAGCLLLRVVRATVCPVELLCLWIRFEVTPSWFSWQTCVLILFS
jgi:hypothetical protein